MVFQTIVQILFLSNVYLLLAKSFEITYKTSGIFNVAHAFTISLAAYISFSAILWFNYAIYIVIPFAILSTTILMTIIDYFFILSFIKKNNKGWKNMVVTLALYYILQNCLIIIWGDNNLPLSFFHGDNVITIFNCRISIIQIIIIGVSFLMIIGLLIASEKTSFGKKIKTISLNPELSIILGVKREKIITYSFVIGCVLASICGICIALYTHISPHLGFNWFFLGVVVMIIGGMGNMRHMFFSALLLAITQQLSAYLLDSKWMNAIAYFILVIFLFFKPFGFSGKKLKKTDV